MHSNERPSPRRLRRLAGWCGWLLYVGTCSPLGVGGAGLLGRFDPDHEVVMLAGTDSVRVVLHHRGNCSPHQHGTVARTLTIFAQPASANDPDHILQFGATISLVKKSEPLPPSTLASNQALTTGTKTGQPFALGTRCPAPVVHPPPDMPVRLLCLRSTVLLV